MFVPRRDSRSPRGRGVGKRFHSCNFARLDHRGRVAEREGWGEGGWCHTGATSPEGFPFRPHWRKSAVNDVHDICRYFAREIIWQLYALLCSIFTAGSNLIVQSRWQYGLHRLIEGAHIAMAGNCKCCGAFQPILFKGSCKDCKNIVVPSQEKGTTREPLNNWVHAT